MQTVAAWQPHLKTTRQASMATKTWKPPAPSGVVGTFRLQGQPCWRRWCATRPSRVLADAIWCSPEVRTGASPRQPNASPDATQARYPPTHAGPQPRSMSSPGSNGAAPLAKSCWPCLIALDGSSVTLFREARQRANVTLAVRRRPRQTHRWRMLTHFLHLVTLTQGQRHAGSCSAIQ